MTSHNWGELTCKDFDELDREHTVVIFPIGSMEQHGPHLPVATDALCASSVVAEMERRNLNLDTIVLPTLWCSKSNEHIDYRGTIFLTRETFGRVVEEISASVARAGFRRLVIMNWHGGNVDYLACLTRDIRQKYNLLTFLLDGGRLVSSFSSYKTDWAKPHHFNIHAERYETSILLATHPELVKPPEEWGLGSDFGHGKMARSFKKNSHLIPEGGPVAMGWVTTDLTDDGVVGDPVGANAAEGKDYLDYIVDQLCEVLPEIAVFDF